MSIRVWKGTINIPIKIFYLLLLAVSIVFLSLIQLLQEKMTKQAPCLTLPPSGHHRRANWLSGDQHPGCSKDPISTSNSSCPECFKTEAFNISDYMYPLPKNISLFPRGVPGYFVPKKEIQYHMVRRALLTPSQVCVDTCPFIVAFQLSVEGRGDERNAVRATWASVAKTKLWPHANMNAELQIVFVLAHNQNTSSDGFHKKKEWAKIKTEADRYGDILYLDMIDSYYNLTLKLMSSFLWGRDHCPRTKFFLKVDADTFVNIPLLMDVLVLSEDVLNFSIMGFIYTKERYVFRTGRWAVSKELYPMHMFPIYVSGCSYILSRDALFKILELSPYVPILPSEDAYVTGILGRMTQVQYFSINLYTLFADHFNNIWDWCEFLNNSRISGTGVNRNFKKTVIWSGYVLNEWECRYANLLRMKCYCEEEFTPPVETKMRNSVTRSRPRPPL